MTKIAFAPSGRQADIEVGHTILDIARDLGVGIESTCGGNGRCAKCQVQIAEGEFAKYRIRSDRSHVTEMTRIEATYRRRGILRDGFRLACCTLVEGELVVDVPAASQSQQQMVRKSANTDGVVLAPITQAYTVRVAEPNMHDQDGDLQWLKKALADVVGIGGMDLGIDYRALVKLQDALKAGKRRVTVVVRDGDIVKVFAAPAAAVVVTDTATDTVAGTATDTATDAVAHTAEKAIALSEKEDENVVYGVAFDIGSTTIAAHLLDLTCGEVLASNGQMNPQIAFGEDVMARVSYAMMNADGLPKMHDAVRQTIAAMIAALVEQAEIDAERVLEAVFVANPIMHHIFLGIDPTPLGQSPFVLATNASLYVDADRLGVGMTEGAKCYLLPCIAGHVGADAASVLLSLKPEQYDGWTLAVDIGTNAEVILGSKDKTYACSSPTGPAFEGAQISCGQRAAVGAIERVMINRDSLEPAFKIIGCDLWSNQDGFAEATRDITISGICGSGIIEVMSELFLSGIIDQDGVFDAALSAKTPRVFAEGRTHAYMLYDGEVNITVNQNDVRQIQLAKAALYAGIKLLMDKAEVAAVDRIFLAGAFGSHIDVKQAMTLGIIPDCDLAQVKSIGNAAGDGAIKALLDRTERDAIDTAVRKIHKIETAIEPAFQDYFVAAMALPNKVDTFPILSQSVAFPIPKITGATNEASGGRRRRRRRR